MTNKGDYCHDINTLSFVYRWILYINQLQQPLDHSHFAIPPLIRDEAYPISTSDGDTVGGVWTSCAVV